MNSQLTVLNYNLKQPEFVINPLDANNTSLVRARPKTNQSYVVSVFFK